MKGYQKLFTKTADSPSGHIVSYDAMEKYFNAKKQSGTFHRYCHKWKELMLVSGKKAEVVANIGYRIMPAAAGESQGKVSAGAKYNRQRRR